MNKQDLAQYLVNLHTLMGAQESTAQQKSSTLADEYNRQWGKLKEMIQQEQENANGGH